MSIVKAYLHPAGTLAFLFLQMGILTVCSGQQASLVVDINKTTTSGVLGNSVAALKGLLYFSGESQSGSGQELWRTDGTEQGTYMVKDIKKGEKSSMPSGLKATSGKIFFLAGNKDDSNVLHVSDGTEKGTRELAGLIKPAASVTMDDAYFYIRTSPFNNTELWRLNGNEDESILIFQSKPDARPFPALYLAGKLIYFIIQPNRDEVELWRTDGTKEGTLLILSSQNEFTGFEAVGDLFFFWKYDQQRGYILCATKGTQESTLEVYGFGTESSAIQSITHTASPTHYICKISINGLDKFYFSDGTKAGTVLFDSGEYLPDTLFYTNGKIFGYRRGIFVSENFSPFQRISDPGLDILGLNSKFYPFEGKVYFNMSTFNEGNEPWVSDGTLEGTKLLSDMVPGKPGSNATPIVILDGELVWVAEDHQYGSELRKLDPSRQNLQLMVDVNKNTNDAYIHDLEFLGDELFFGADDGVLGPEIYSYHTKTNKLNLMELVPGFDGSYPGYITSFKNYLIYNAYDTDGSVKLWSMDGNTRKVTDISFPDPSFTKSFIGGYAVCRDILYFIGAYGSEKAVFTTDGTSESTRLVCSGLGSTLESLFCVNDVLYFTANRGTLYQLPAGNASPNFILERSDIRELVRLNDLLIFKSNDGITGHTMWSLNEKDGVVNLIKLMEPGFYEPFPSDFYIFDKKVFFLAYNENKERELWSTDGTKAGTSLVRAIIGSPGNIDAIHMIASDSLIFILLSDFVMGYRSLWRSDGTEQGTFNLTTYQKFDLEIGISLGTWKNLVYFQGSDDTNGIELWVSDGSLENTVMVQDICPGSCSSYPESFVSRDSSLYFVANTTSYGYELWQMKGGIPKPETYDTISGSSLRILQNPILARSLSFEVLNVTDGQLNFDLYSTSGYNVWSNSVSLVQAGGVFEYQLPNLPQGLYILCVKGIHTNLKAKIIIGQ